MSAEDKPATDSVDQVLRENIVFENEEISPLGQASSDSPVARPLANETKWGLNSMLSRPKYVETFTISGATGFQKFYKFLTNKAYRTHIPKFTVDFLNHFGMNKFDQHIMVTLTTNQYLFGAAILGLLPCVEPVGKDDYGIAGDTDYTIVSKLYKYIDYSTQDGADICNPFSRPRPMLTNLSSKRLQDTDKGQGSYYVICLRSWAPLKGPTTETPNVTFKVFSYIDNISYDYYRLADTQ
jgi:hypothetical protein